MMSLQSLAQQCSSDQKRYLRKEIAHSVSCYELFRMALVQNDQDAWAFLYTQFVALIKSAVHKSRVRVDQTNLCPRDNQDLADDAFETMRKLITPEKFREYTNLGALLVHLKRNALYVVLNCRRASATRVLNSMPDDEISTNRGSVGRPVEDQVLGNLQYRKLYRLIYGRMKNKKEKLVFDALFRDGMKPREILENYPGKVATIEEVYRIKANLLERISRDPQILALQDQNER
jgi:hypothetical protein